MFWLYGSIVLYATESINLPSVIYFRQIQDDEIQGGDLQDGVPFLYSVQAPLCICRLALQLVEVIILLGPIDESTSHRLSSCIQKIRKGLTSYPSHQPVVGSHILRYNHPDDIEEVISQHWWYELSAEAD